MKRVIQFTKIRWIMIGISLVLIIGLNVSSMFIHKKLNLGIDFAGGMTMQVQIAPVAFTVQYQGDGTADLLVGGNVLTLKVNNAGKNEDYSYNFDNYDSIKAVVADIQKVSGFSIDPGKYSDAKPQKIISLSYPVTLSKGMSAAINMRLPSAKEMNASIHDIRNMLVSLGSPSIQNIGADENQEFAVKIQQGEFANQAIVDKKDSATSSESSLIEAAQKKLVDLLSTKYDKNTILIKSTDFVGPSFSKELLNAAIIAVIIAVLLILIYISFRFKLDFGIGAIIALIHDVLMMIGFICFFNLEWNATTIAAILTIIGYSNNDTIVIYARIRENLKVMHDIDTEMIINTSITQSISRSIYTHLTVLFSIIPIYFLTTGAIKDFSFNMIIGVISGTYSSIYMAAPVVLMWRNFTAKSKKQKSETEYGKKFPDKPEPVAQKAEVGATSVEANGAEVVSTSGSNQPQAARLQKKKKKKRR